MTGPTRQVSWTAIALAALLWACVEDAATPPELPDEAPRASDARITSRGNFSVPESQMRALLRRVTREVAVALADEALRATVHGELHASPYREHKLHLGTFLQNGGQELLRAMAAVRQGEPSGITATLDSIVDLEFYMPVKEHFAAWDGGPSLIVASALRDDDTPPDGFDLAGRPIGLSAATPPPTPTLVLVPVETDFSTNATPPAPSGADATTSSIAGMYMTRAVVYSDHEGWPRGNPEFEVHLFQTDVDHEYIDQICAGQQQVPPYQWNTEETQNWSGEVLLATEGRLALSENNQFQMWEDDSEACSPSGGRPPRADDLTVSEMTSWASAFLGIVAAATGDVVDVIKFLLNAVPAAYNFYVDASDDPVGVLTLAGGCWPLDPGPAKFVIISSANGHPETGWATLDPRFDAQREPICPMSASISGPSFVYANNVITWTAVVSNGTAPYTYQWYRDGAPVSTQQSYTGNTGWSDFVLRVDVIDAVGRNAGSTKSVTVSSCPPPEIQCEE